MLRCDLGNLDVTSLIGQTKLNVEAVEESDLAQQSFTGRLQATRESSVNGKPYDTLQVNFYVREISLNTRTAHTRDHFNGSGAKVDCELLHKRAWEHAMICSRVYDRVTGYKFCSFSDRQLDNRSRCDPPE